VPILGLLTRFALAAALGLGGALTVAAITAPPAASLLPAPDAAYQLTADTGDEAVAFGLTAVPDETPVVLQALPDDKTIQLVAFAEAGGAPATGSTRPAWLLPTGFPRVPPITQFDGGPLGNANCTMASGAMLARLGYGIVTTGSQLRALQPDQEGGTSLADLQVAIGKWGVSFSQGAVSALQLRALLYAGAGAVVQVDYGEIPVTLRLQGDFTGGHAMYLDGFRPAGADGPAGYFVVDPLGPTWTGYKGSWWPADVVEAAAVDFGGGSIFTAWAFPGGSAPADPPPLPPSAFPSPTVAPGATPTPTLDPGATPTAAPTPPPLPSPAASLAPPPSGDEPPALPPGWWKPDWGEILAGGVVMSPIFTICIVDPEPWCPGGIIGIWPAAATPPPTLPPLPPFAIDLLYANPIGGGLMQVIFTAPEGATPALQFWGTNAPSGPLMVAPSVEAAILDGATVQVATFPIREGVDYAFVASARALGLNAISQVGTAGP
jgi:hypothetical protein